jgi:dolichyl-phosphate-mannose--protein O-mannosyl transferase
MAGTSVVVIEGVVIKGLHKTTIKKLQAHKNLRAHESTPVLKADG